MVSSKATRCLVVTGLKDEVHGSTVPVRVARSDRMLCGARNGEPLCSRSSLAPSAIVEHQLVAFGSKPVGIV